MIGCPILATPLFLSLGWESRKPRSPSTGSFMSTAPKTLFEKVWEQHVVVEPEGEPTLLYIDLQLLHEVTSPQAFEGLRLAGRKVRRPDRSIATVDHNVPTTIEGRLHILDQIAAKQISTCAKTATIRHRALRRRLARAGHRPRHRPRARHHQARHDHRLRRLAHQHPRRIRRTCIWHRHQRSRARARHANPAAIASPKPFASPSKASCPRGVTAKDIILAIIGQIGTDGATGCVIEYAGSAIRALSMEGRMTICNMSIEAGARAGMIAPDEKTFAYLKGRRFSPQGAAWDAPSPNGPSYPPTRRNLRSRTHQSTPRIARSLRQLGHQSRHGCAHYRFRSRPCGHYQ